MMKKAAGCLRRSVGRHDERPTTRKTSCEAAKKEAASVSLREAPVTMEVNSSWTLAGEGFHVPRLRDKVITDDMVKRVKKEPEMKRADSFRTKALLAAATRIEAEQLVARKPRIRFQNNDESGATGLQQRATSIAFWARHQRAQRQRARCVA